MAKQIVNEMATNLTLDSNSASQALKELTREVKNSSAEAKILESQYKASGDAVSASKAKYEGLQSTLEAQKTKIEALKNGLDNVNTSTKKGQDLQQYLNGELAKAERQYASYQGQLEKATQSYKYQESGLAKLNDEMRHGNALTDARVQKLEAEGRTEEAQKAKLEGLKSSQANYTKQLEIQQKELKDLSATGDKSSDSYKRQELRVEQMGAKLAQTTGKIRNFNHTDVKPETKGIGHVKSQLESLDDKIKSTKSYFGSIFMGNLLANGVSNALGSVKSKLGEVIREGSEYVKYQSTMKASWDTLTGSAKDGQKMVDMTNDMAQAASNSTEMVDDLNKKLYAVTNSSGETGKLTKSILTLQDAFGVTDDAVKGFGMQWSQMVGNGKVSAQDFMSFTNVFPKIKQQLLEYEQQQTGNHKLSMQQLNDMISNGKISSDTMNKVLLGFADKYKDATQNFASTIPGLERTIKARMPAVVAAFEQPLMKMKNPLLKSVGDWVSDKNTEKEFTKLGNSLSKSLGVITKAFGSEFKGFDFNKGANGAIDSLSRSIEKFGDYVAKHKDDIVDFFKMVKSLGASGFSTLGLTLKIALPLLEDLGKFAAKHPTTFKVLAASVIGFNLALKGTLGTMVAFGKAKSAFMFGKGLFIKPRVDGSSAKRELGIISKMAVGLGKSFWWTAKLAGKTVLKTLEGIGGATIGIGKGFWWTAKLATKGVLKALEGIGGATIWTGKKIGKSLVWTAKLATKGFNVALAGMVKGAKLAGSGIKTAFNFAKANPLLLIVTAVVAVGVALYELYKHNKKFRTFINGLIKGVQDFFKGVGKWMGKVWSSIKGVVNKVTKIFKKDWKELLLLIINPFAGAFALVYKHNKKFRNAINGLVKSVKNFFTNMWKSVKSIFNHLVKDLNHSLNWFKKVWRDSLNFISDFISDIWNGIKKNVTNTAKRLWNNIVGSVNNFKNRFLKIWNDIKGFFRDTWNGIKGIGSRAINSLKDTLGDGLGKIGKAFGDTWDGVKKGFGKFWDGLKQMASDGLNAVISPINSGINGINSLIHDFGGPKSAIGNIPKVKFANGTGAIDRLTHAVLNDGNDSPETGNKETLIHPNGKMEVVQGRNTQRLLLPGTEVLNASETKMLMAMQGIRHFANGTGFFGGIWKGIKGVGSTVANVAGDAWDGMKDGVKKFTKMFKFITDAVAHPIKTLEGVFNPKNGGLTGAVGDITGGFIKKAKNQVKDWWSELWSMAKDAGEGGSGSSSELLNKAIKYGTGKPYVWGATGPDSFDCSGLVQYTLKQMGKSFPHYSGDQYNSSTAVSKPSVGDLVFFGGGGSEHVGIYSGGGKMFSAQSPDSHPNIGYAKISDWSESVAKGGYRKVPGISTKDDTKEDKGGSSLQKLIKSQVGGMFKWISKYIAPLNDDAGGSEGAPSGDGVGRWRSQVKQALEANGLSTSASMVNKVLRQINTESSGNEKAVQGVHDINSGGNEARGLMQTVPGTFNAYKHKGHGDIMNGYDNLLAALAYAKDRYGSGLSALGNGHGYANGGLITKHQIAEIGEGNRPEMIIPLDGLKSSRGYELLGRTMSVMAARDNLASQSTDNGGLEKLEAKFDSMIQLLGQLVQGQANPTPAYVIANQASQEIDRLKGINNRANRTALG